MQININPVCCFSSPPLSKEKKKKQNMKLSQIFFIIFILYLPVVTRSHDSTFFNVLDYGAAGDGRTDDTKAFEQAWQQTCASSSSPVMVVPSAKTFLISPVRFEGYCESDNVTVQIDGDLLAPNEPWSCPDHDCGRWIYFHKINGLKLLGGGTIDGRGQNWWNQHKKKAPTAVEISSSDDVFLGGGLQFKNSPRMHLVLNGLQRVQVSNIKIEAPGHSPNTDGIHVTDCTNAVIDHCQIQTGDDCISIVDGSVSVAVSNVTCGPGHGISIGSLGKHGSEDRVENITVSDVVFIGSTNGARIKTWQGGKGYAKNILFERILLHETANPIIIDQYYCDHELCSISNSAVQVMNVTFREIVGSSKKKTAVKLNCSETVPCKEIVMEDIHIRVNKDEEATFECRNVHGRAHGHQVPKMDCFS